MIKKCVSFMAVFCVFASVFAEEQGVSNRVDDLVSEESLPLIIGANSIITDVAKSLGFHFFRFRSFVGPGQDPHSFQPTPQDVALLEDAALVFINGLGLEEHLMPYFDALPEGKVVDLSANISPRFCEAVACHAHPPHGYDHEEGDPHVWGDPNNVKIWATLFAKQFIRLLPEQEEAFIRRSYRTRYNLDQLISRMKALILTVPAKNRILATDHDVLGYLADLYDFRMEVVVHPSFSSVGQPSAQEAAQLIERIKKRKLPALFVTTTVPSKLCEQIAEEAGIKVVSLPFETLKDDRQFYEEMMYDVVEKIVQALK